MLRTLRNALVSNQAAQRAIRASSRAGILPSGIYRRIPPLGPHPVDTPAGNEFTYVADLDDTLARRVVWENLRSWERTSLEVLSDLARTSERFVDVGAYTGIYSIVACLDGPGEAIALEPNPRVVPLLEANVRANGLADRVTVVAMGASDAPGTARMRVPNDITAATIVTRGDGPAVELTTVDDVVRGRTVDVIKIDVEGLEVQVLRGAEETLARHRPSLIVECLSDEAFNEVRAVLHPLGYRSCHHLGPDGPQQTNKKLHTPGHANDLWSTG